MANITDRLRHAYQALRTATPPAAPQQRATGRGSGSLQSGGIYNPVTGLGTGLDKSTGNLFTPTRIYWRTPLEILYVESWVARKAINTPIDDMFIRWRQFQSDDEGVVEAMEEVERDLRVEKALNNVLKGADIYGTGVVVMATAEASLDTPLDVKRIREGDLEGVALV